MCCPITPKRVSNQNQSSKVSLEFMRQKDILLYWIHHTRIPVTEVAREATPKNLNEKLPFVKIKKNAVEQMQRS